MRSSAAEADWSKVSPPFNVTSALNVDRRCHHADKRVLKLAAGCNANQDNDDKILTIIIIIIKLFIIVIDRQSLERSIYQDCNSKR